MYEVGRAKIECWDTDGFRRGSKVDFEQNGSQIIATSNGYTIGEVPLECVNIIEDLGIENIQAEIKVIGFGYVEIALYDSSRIDDISGVEYPEAVLRGVDAEIRLYSNFAIYLKDSGESERKELNSVVARVESGEEASSRITVTRMLLVGIFSLAIKKNRGGEKFLTLEGPDFLWALECSKTQTNDAVRFAVKVNDKVKQLGTITTHHMEGLASKDGRLHAAVFERDSSGESESLALMKSKTSEVEPLFEKIQSSGYEIVEASYDGTQLFVTYK